MELLVVFIIVTFVLNALIMLVALQQAKGKDTTIDEVTKWLEGKEND